jgi:hypothetical protein
MSIQRVIQPVIRHAIYPPLVQHYSALDPIVESTSVIMCRRFHGFTTAPVEKQI